MPPWFTTDEYGTKVLSDQGIIYTAALACLAIDAAVVLAVVWFVKHVVLGA